jgi:hypothetical protein
MKTFVLILILCLIVVSQLVNAEPQFSSITGQSCFLCHSNPTGRTMRSLYGSQFFSPTYLSFVKLNDEALKKFNPSLSEAVTIGADLRTIFLSENTHDKSAHAGLSAPLSTNTGSMSQMEGYLYLELQPWDRFSIFWSQGVASATGRFEAYGIADVLPLHGYIKAGQFQESFGWNWTDHTSFVRTGLFSDYDGTPTNLDRSTSIPNPPGYGVGGEIGIRPWKFEITASYTNIQTTIPTGKDMQKRWSARAMIQQGIKKYNLQFTGGGSYYYAPRKSADPEYPIYFPETKKDYGWGGFAGIGWQGLLNKVNCHGGFGFLATNLMFEYDRRAHFNQDAAPMTGAFVTSAYSTAQINTQIQPGLWLLAAYDWLNNGYDLQHMDGTYAGREATRSTFGIQAYPLPWVEISPRYRLLSGPLSSRNTQQAELQLHFFF